MRFVTLFNHDIFLSLIRYILLSGIIISVFLSLLLLRKQNKSTGDFIFLFLLLSSGFGTFSYHLVYTGEYLNFPTLVGFGSGIPLLTGPFLFLYTKYQTQPIFFKKTDLIHFLPFLLLNIFFFPFYLLSFDQKVDFLKNNGAGFEWQLIFKIAATYLSGIIYITWNFIRLSAYKKKLKVEFSSLSKVNFNWLLLLNVGLGVVWILVIFIQSDEIIFSAASLYVMCIGFFGTTQAPIFSEREIQFVQHQDNLSHQEELINPTTAEEPKGEKVHDTQIEEIYQSAITLLKSEKLYLNPELKVLDLAIQLNVHPHLMSKAINQISASTFYDLINKLRVEEFIQKSQSYDANKFTIMGLAYESGFNSKASFYRNFKAIIGMSPSEFIKSNESNID